jgi:hypothetical protein
LGNWVDFWNGLDSLSLHRWHVVLHADQVSAYQAPHTPSPEWAWPFLFFVLFSFLCSFPVFHQFYIFIVNIYGKYSDPEKYMEQTNVQI